MSTTIVLTGVTGFLGSALLRGLLANDYEVIGIKRSTSDTWRIKDAEHHPRLHLFDVDQADPAEIFNKHRVDAIVHTATEYGRDGAPVYKILEANLILPIRLAEMGINAGTKLFINTDSYFNKGNHSYSHLLNYSLSKKSLLIWLGQISKRLKIINAVLEHIYGPYDGRAKFVETLIQQIAIQKQDRVSLTHGHQKRDFIYIDDVVDAFLKLLQFGLTHEFSFKSYEIGTGQSVQVADLARSIKTLSGSPTHLGLGELPYRSDEIMESVAENSELRQIGWSPQVDLTTGIKKILAAYSNK